MKYLVSAQQPPAFVPGIEYWERSISPDPGSVKAGWRAIDWAEAPLHFVADGEEATANMDYLVRPGLYNRPAAYPNTPNGLSIWAAHNKLKGKK